MNFLSTTLAFGAILISGVLQTTPTIDKVVDGPFYNLRYCEILLGELESLGQANAIAYNTVFCNDCPQEAWEELDFRSIAQEYGAIVAVPNGPRYFLMDSISVTEQLDPCSGTFGDIEMTKVAVVKISARQAIRRKPYVEGKVDRTTTYQFRAGREVYVLKSPNDKCYIMQTYSQQLDPTLQLEDLKNLGSQLDLPRGWTFEVIQLTEDFYLEAPNDEATLIQDELQNSYQYLHEGCLN